MKLDDIKTQEDLDKFVKSLVEKSIEEATAGLVNKNNELLGKLKKAKEPDAELDSLKEQAEELKKLKQADLEKQGEYKKLLEQSKEQHATKVKELETNLANEKNVVKDLLVDQGLTKELTVAKVNPVLLDAAVSLLSPEVTIVEDGGKRNAMVGEKGITDFVKDWAASDVGKNFVLASDNSGAGAQGNNQGDNKSPAEAHFKTATWNLTEQGKISLSDPKLYADLHAKYPSKNSHAEQIRQSS